MLVQPGDTLVPNWYQLGMSLVPALYYLSTIVIPQVQAAQKEKNGLWGGKVGWESRLEEKGRLGRCVENQS